MKRVLMAGIVLACLVAPPAAAQVDRSRTEAIANDMEARLNAPQNPALAPVDSLNCEQMGQELVVAGQQMNAQMDPSLATNVQDMRDNAQDRMREAQVGMVGAGLMCAVPGLGMACGALMQAQTARQMEHAQEDQQRMDVVMGQMNDSMAGIDLARMQALNQRWEAEQCQMPEQTPAQ